MRHFALIALVLLASGCAYNSRVDFEAPGALKGERVVWVESCFACGDAAKQTPMDLWLYNVQGWANREIVTKKVLGRALVEAGFKLENSPKAYRIYLYISEQTVNFNNDTGYNRAGYSDFSLSDFVLRVKTADDEQTVLILNDGKVNGNSWASQAERIVPNLIRTLSEMWKD